KDMGLNSNLQMICILLLFVWVAEAGGLTRVFNLNDFGAIADGKSDSSQALLGAWKNACACDGTGIVLIPQGTYLVGPTILKGPCKRPTVFQIQGVLKAPADLRNFGSGAWIEFQHINGLTIAGGGKFDGQGASAWPHNQCSKNAYCKDLPISIRLNFVTNGLVRNISSINSKFFHMEIFGSKNIKLQSLKISAPGNSPNTDGIHIGKSSMVDISNSVIGTGDDCISIGPGNSDISISNVFCGPGHGISVGSLGKYPNEADVVGLNVRNCTLSGTANGVRIKTWAASSSSSASSSSASNLNFQDIVMKNVYNPIVIDQQYCPHTSCNQESPSRVKISNVCFKDITGTSASKVAVSLKCSKATPCQNVELININLNYVSAKNHPDRGRASASISSCSNIEGTASGEQIPPSCL
ncbi:exopolygalacturonase-like, partial [Tasmannia lanceolata]|uniref:exopolygalacturonase-like n=1 Tax=Tasmannia lanceolata TaxID=3420 RepID=UPI004062ED95